MPEKTGFLESKRNSSSEAFTISTETHKSFSLGFQWEGPCLLRHEDLTVSYVSCYFHHLLNVLTKTVIHGGLTDLQFFKNDSLIFFKRLDREERLFLLVQENIWHHQDIIVNHEKIEFKDIPIFFFFSVFNSFSASTNKNQITSEWAKKKKESDRNLKISKQQCTHTRKFFRN